MNLDRLLWLCLFFLGKLGEISKIGGGWVVFPSGLFGRDLRLVVNFENQGACFWQAAEIRFIFRAPFQIAKLGVFDDEVGQS